MKQNAAPNPAYCATSKAEREVLIPANPAPDPTNRRMPLGQQPLIDRTAGVFPKVTTAVPGANTPTTPTVSDTRTGSGAGTGTRIGPQPSLPQTKPGDLAYGTHTVGKRAADGSFEIGGDR